MAAAAAVAAAAAFAMFVVMVMAVATAATIMIVVVAMIVPVSTVYMTMLQLFRRCFANRDNFNVELQILTSQHVVTVNNNVFVTHFGDFYRYRTLIGFRQKRMPTCSSSTPINTSLGTR